MGFDIAQQIGERRFAVAFGEFAGGGEEILRRPLDLFREPAPVETVRGFDRHDAVERLKREGGLCAGAAIGVAVHANGLFGWREAEGGAGGEREVGLFLGEDGLRQHLVEQVEFEI